MLSSAFHNVVASSVRKARELHLTVGQAKDRIAGLVKLAQERSQAVGHGLQALGEVASTIGEAERHAQQTATLATSTASDLGGTAETLEGLAAAAERIEEVLERVKAVAEQTRLLALNATIEAARAGEHGKGFAVVASEVKDLSDVSASAAEQIVEEVAAIQAAVQSSRTGLDGVLASFGQLEEACGAIAATMQTQSKKVGAAERSLAGADEGVRLIVEAINGVQVGVTEDLGRARDLESETVKLHELSEQEGRRAS